MVIERFAVYLVALDPTVGTEIQKTRPCVIISPDEINRTIATVIVAPMTTQGRPYPSRVACHFEEKEGQIILDQMRAVDKRRLLKRLGQIAPATQQDVLRVLAAIFAA
jgi:mRNA interferase MazF